MEKGDFSALGGFNVTSNTCVPNNGVAICLKDPSTGTYYPGNQIPASELGSANALRLRKSLRHFRSRPMLPARKTEPSTTYNASFPPTCRSPSLSIVSMKISASIFVCLDACIGRT